MRRTRLVPLSGLFASASATMCRWVAWPWRSVNRPPASSTSRRTEAMFSGERINVTENRPVLHVALRAPRDAVIEAGRRRLRPILMTTATTVLGLLPLALGIGEGADAQAPMARAVIGGLLGSTLISLVLIPVVYSLFHPERADAR